MKGIIEKFFIEKKSVNFTNKMPITLDLMFDIIEKQENKCQN